MTTHEPKNSPNTVEPPQPNDHVRGADNPAITVIAYGDFDCPHTRASHATVERLLAENDDVRFVFRHFPLRHMHAKAESLARIAEAASRQGDYWPLYDRLMHQRRLDERSALAEAGALNIDVDAIERAMNEPAVIARIQHDVDRGTASGVQSTPTFFFDGLRHDGKYDHATLARRLDEARRR